MSRPVVLGCLLLAACEPVLLVADTKEDPGLDVQETKTPAEQPGGAGIQPGDRDAEVEEEPGAVSGAAETEPSGQPSAEPLEVKFSVRATDCGSCFDLLARGSGGVPPYRYEWEDGSDSDRRRVCAGTGELEISVVAEDSTAARSTPYVTYLQSDVSDAADCPAGTGQPVMCLDNLSFEGEPAINTGQMMFDAFPWSECVDPANAGIVNTPDIANETLDPMTGIAPAPSQGKTYLAMRTAEFASQELCEPLNAGSKTALRLDLVRMDIGTPDMYLQIWGGVSANCSQRQLLWVSPALSTTWTSYCVPIEPGEFMDLITLRAETPMPDLVVNYLAVDNLVPVSSCP